MIRVLCVALALSAASYASAAFAQEAEPDQEAQDAVTETVADGPVLASQVIDWIYFYAARYEIAPSAPLRVARCESGGFSVAVLNGWKLGRLGEVGTFQFHPRGIWWSTPQAAAGYSYWDAEANVAAGVWAIAQGYGPRHWAGCWG